jgi:5'-deoxynucleotidase YfbR-like HD superfamily hydrolase
MEPPRAWVRLPSGRRLDLLAPTPFDWTDEDLALGLARTFRWGGHSAWPQPLSVAQHALTVLALRRSRTRHTMDAPREMRELLHDAEEGLINFDCISPLKPFLGEGFSALSERLTRTVAARYRLPAWTPDEKRAHKSADIAAAAAEAVHVAGWTPREVRETLGITGVILARDPLAARYAEAPWRPWTPDVAAERFLEELTALQARRDHRPGVGEA